MRNIYEKLADCYECTGRIPTDDDLDIYHDANKAFNRFEQNEDVQTVTAQADHLQVLAEDAIKTILILKNAAKEMDPVILKKCIHESKVLKLSFNAAGVDTGAISECLYEVEQMIEEVIPAFETIWRFTYDIRGDLLFSEDKASDYVEEYVRELVS